MNIKMRKRLLKCEVSCYINEKRRLWKGVIGQNWDFWNGSKEKNWLLEWEWSISDKSIGKHDNFKYSMIEGIWIPPIIRGKETTTSWGTIEKGRDLSWDNIKRRGYKKQQESIKKRMVDRVVHRARTVEDNSSVQDLPGGREPWKWW